MVFAWISLVWLRRVLQTTTVEPGYLGALAWAAVQVAALLFVGLKVLALARWLLLVGATGRVPERAAHKPFLA